jgi:hypothetical protein
LLFNGLIMAYKRKNPISAEDQQILTAIGQKILKLRKSTGLSIERFCAKNDIPRISYTNLESGRNFHMTTLLKVLNAHPEIKNLYDFFRGI